MMRLFLEMVGWMSLLVSAAGATVSAIYIGRSRWVALLVVGFGAETTVSLFYRVAATVPGVFGSGSREAGYLLASLLGLTGHAAVVGGIAALLSERSSGSTAAPQADTGPEPESDK